jgi:hypothetical protein
VLDDTPRDGARADGDADAGADRRRLQGFRDSIREQVEERNRNGDGDESHV